MQDLNNLYVLLFSHSQKAFHVMTLPNVINDGQNSIFGHRHTPSDWICVGISEQREEIRELGRRIHQQMSGEAALPDPLPVKR